MTHKILSGFGSIEQLASILQEIDPKKILLVTGKASYESCGAKAAIAPLVQAYNVSHFYDFKTSFAYDDLERGMNLHNQEQPDLIMGVGGGSVMDMAKAIAILAPQQQDAIAIIKTEKEGNPRTTKTIMIPTTAGTGSESDRYSVVYIDNIKYSLFHPSSVPDYAILDPSFTRNLPPDITAITGFDALSQSIESLWAVASTESSRKLSREALTILKHNLAQAVNAPDDKSREQMLLGSNIAGLAINTATTTAPHAVSYPMTGFYGIPHGQGVALTLPYFLEHNANVNQENIQDERGVETVKKQMNTIIEALGVTTAEEARDYLIKLAKKCGLKTTLSELHLDEEAKAKILEHGFNPSRMKNNPVRVTKEDLKNILDKIT